MRNPRTTNAKILFDDLNFNDNEYEEMKERLLKVSKPLETVKSEETQMTEISS